MAGCRHNVPHSTFSFFSVLNYKPQILIGSVMKWILFVAQSSFAPISGGTNLSVTPAKAGVQFVDFNGPRRFPE